MYERWKITQKATLRILVERLLEIQEHFISELNSMEQTMSTEIPFSFIDFERY
jgi:hypothetical protein